MEGKRKEEFRSLRYDLMDESEYQSFDTQNSPLTL